MMKAREQMSMIFAFVLAIMMIPCNILAYSGKTSEVIITSLEDDFNCNTDLWLYSGNAYRDIDNECIVFAKKSGSQTGMILLKEKMKPPFQTELKLLCEGGADNDYFALIINNQECVVHSMEGLRISENVWHDILVVVDRTYMKVYVDGKVSSLHCWNMGSPSGSVGFRGATGYTGKFIIDKVSIKSMKDYLSYHGKASSMTERHETGAAKTEAAFPYRNIYEERSFEGKIELYGMTERVPVLMYHHMLLPEDKTDENNLIVTTKEFDEQMEYLFENDYTTITTKELGLFLDGKLDLPEKSVLITFDDGYQSNYIYAYPILKKYGFKASISLIPKFMTEKPQDFNPAKMTYLSWQEVVSGSDVFEYTNHTYSHVSLKGLGYKKVLEEIRNVDDILKSKCFVYPIGHTSANSEKVLREFGYELAFTTRGGYVNRSSDRLHLRRQRVNAGISLRAFISLL